MASSFWATLLRRFASASTPVFQQRTSMAPVLLTCNLVVLAYVGKVFGDVVQTVKEVGTDAVRVGADAVKVGADAVQVGAEAVQSFQDAVKIGAEGVQSFQDAVKVGAEAVQSFQERGRHMEEGLNMMKHVLSAGVDAKASIEGLHIELTEPLPASPPSSE